jgi:hypothetical protein
MTNEPKRRVSVKWLVWRLFWTETLRDALRAESSTNYLLLGDLGGEPGK